MAVKKNNATTDDAQETTGGGNVGTVNNNSSESLVHVDVETKGVAKQVTVVVQFGNTEQTCSKGKGETPRSPPKTNPWNVFQTQNKGSNLTMRQLAAKYKASKKNHHESLTTDGS